MNTAIIFSADHEQQKAALEKRIAKLRAQIKQEQDRIEGLLAQVQQSAREDMREIEDTTSVLRGAVKRFRAAVASAQTHKSFKKKDRQELVDIEQSLFVELHFAIGPLASFVFNSEEEGAGFPFQAASVNEQESQPAEETEDSRKQSPEVEAEEVEKSQPYGDEEARRYLFEHKEEWREYIEQREQKRRLRDPFSEESIKALRQSPEDAEIRRIYLALSKQVHPDLAANAEEARVRTAIMQELSVAYKQRDFAALLTIQERLIVQEGEIAAVISSDTIISMESIISRLEQQLKLLKNHTARMKRSKTGKILKARKSGEIESFSEMVGPAIAEVGRTADLIEAALEGKISVKEMFKQLADLPAESEPEDDYDMDELVDLLGEFFHEVEKSVGGRRRRRK